MSGVTYVREKASLAFFVLSRTVLYPHRWCRSGAMAYLLTWPVKNIVKNKTDLNRDD